MNTLKYMFPQNSTTKTGVVMVIVFWPPNYNWCSFKPSYNKIYRVIPFQLWDDEIIGTVNLSDEKLINTMKLYIVSILWYWLFIWSDSWKNIFMSKIYFLFYIWITLTRLMDIDSCDRLIGELEFYTWTYVWPCHSSTLW